jgi:hypothetical protein
MEFVFRVSKDGGMDFGERNRVYFKQYLASNAGALCKITPVLPESNKQRRFLEGAIIPLVTYYQDGLNHRDAADRAKVREWLKLEFNAESVNVAGEVHKIPKSTRGREALNKFLEAVVEWLQDNYAPPVEALDPASFKLWRDTVMDGPDNYIDWLVSTGVLK